MSCKLLCVVAATCVMTGVLALFVLIDPMHTDEKVQAVTERNVRQLLQSLATLPEECDAL